MLIGRVQLSRVDLMSQMKSTVRKVRKLPYSKINLRSRSKNKLAMTEESSDNTNREFLCGVVEGFYGRPWTFDQRKELFIRMKALGMGTYLYAPKDDLKHRALWRDLYNLEESENLRQLIHCARENGIEFYYAISPGLDMIFSSAKEVELLKKKMKQMQSLGCDAFAILFDDIDPELKCPDENVFSNFGEAQVQVTNDILKYLKKPKFLFCPTEYCATRAVPNVEGSEYLNILGQKLDPNIDIMWTGPKVISQVITPHSIQALTNVLKRKPVIWDNIHANDYDQRRMFLGPYNGRSTQLYNNAGGILTNPNCEFESNFIAIHTLATWMKCAKGEASTSIEEPMNLDPEAEKLTSEQMDEDKKDVLDDIPPDEVKIEKIEEDKGDGSSSDVKDFPMETDSGTTVQGPRISHLSGPYDPDLALKEAVGAWLLEFSKEKTATSRMYATSGACTIMPPTSVQKQAPLASSTTNCVNSACKPSFTKTAKENSRKRLNTTPPPGKRECSKEETESLMEVAEVKYKKQHGSSLTLNDLLLLVDLFYLPYNHGVKAKYFISEFKWLKVNAINEDFEEFKELTEQEQKMKMSQWKERAEKFHNLCQDVSDMFIRFSETRNRALLYDIYPYLWDIKEIVSLLDTFVTWLKSKSKLKRQRPNFFPDDPEPWVFRGGLCGELQRLLPIDGSHELFNLRAPEVPTTCVYTIRPFQPEDEKAMYEICLSTCDNGQDGHDLFLNEPSMAGDRFVGPYISICPEHLFVIEDSYGLCGYAVSTTDSRQFYSLYNRNWCQEVCKKYPRPVGDCSEWTYAEQISESFHRPTIFLPEDLYSRHRAHVRIDLLPRAQDQFLGKRLLTCVLSALKAEGCNGVYSEINLANRDSLEFYCRLGFYEIALKEELPEDILIYGRTF